MGSTIAVDRRSAVPLYAQLCERLAQDIRLGRLPVGEPFYSERGLMESFGVSSITARRVMTELAREGLIERRNGVGTFVRATARAMRLALVVLEFQEPERIENRQPASVFGELVGGIAQVAWETAASFTLAFIRRQEELAPWLEEALDTRSTDGVLVRTSGDVLPETLDDLDRAGLPYVLLRRRAPGSNASCALTGDREGIALVTDHLLKLGHERLGFVLPVSARATYEDRLGGYRSALQAHGLPFDRRFVAEVPDYSSASGTLGARDLLDRAPDARPTALVAASDSLAIGAYEAAAQLGLAIPADVSVVGLTDIPEAAVLGPPLTTARTSYADLGARAVRLLERLIEARWAGSPLGPEVEVVEPQLVVRASTAPPSPR